MDTPTKDLCPLCGGSRQPGTTTFTAELGFGVVVVRSVPATICSQCGADWIADDVAARIDTIVEDAKRKHAEVQVMAFS